MSDTVTLLDLNDGDKHTAKVRDVTDAQALIERVWPAAHNDELQQQAVGEAAVALSHHMNCGGRCDLPEHIAAWDALGWLQLDAVEGACTADFIEGWASDSGTPGARGWRTTAIDTLIEGDTAQDLLESWKAKTPDDEMPQFMRVELCDEDGKVVDAAGDDR